PGISMSINEITTEMSLADLRRGDIDIAILATRHEDPQLLEIPLYREALVLYASEGHPLLEQERIDSLMLRGDDLWVLRSEHCLSGQVFDICRIKTDFSACYCAGNIFTLINIIDSQGGYTIIPEFHLSMLAPEQRSRVRRLEDPEPVRTVSMYIRNDYFREGMLNAVAECICDQVPKEMLDERMAAGPIRI
ncbi:MAG: hydrogen peroxide-inducible genes activator, partial [Bacteroidales bacterium]|nr:hydrogen peroxide-inducible genes activator [Bacteroidales bacterium]